MVLVSGADQELRAIIDNGVGVLAGGTNGSSSDISGEYHNGWKAFGRGLDHIMAWNATRSNGYDLDELKSDANHYAIEAGVSWVRPPGSSRGLEGRWLMVRKDTMPTVLVTSEPLYGSNGSHVARLRAAGFAVAYPPRVPLIGEDEVIESLRGVAAVIAGSEPYSERVLARLPELQIVARCGVGLDQVDLQAAERLGVAVAITPDGNHEAVAEHTMALLLALTRTLVRNDREVRRGLWGKTTLVPLRGKTLGIIGLGRIGRSVARRAASFRVTILGHDPHVDQAIARAHGVELTGLETLLERSDIITLHLPLTSATRGLIGRAALARMKPGSFLINTARGGLIVEADLVDALQSGHLAGAGLDVLGDEPPGMDNPLLALDNVLISPHLAANDDRSIRDMAEAAAQNIIDRFQGDLRPPALVTPPGPGRRDRPAPEEVS